jgi:hypothetical protein
MDFVLVERDERISLSSKKIDNLIERNNFFQVIKNVSKLLVNKTDIINVEFDFNLNNMVKEIFWTFNFVLNNYEITTNSRNNYIDMNNMHNMYNQNNTWNFNNIWTNSIVFDDDIILNTKFYIDGVRRDGVNFLDASTLNKFNKITTILNPYRYNIKVDLTKGYNVYSFALEPTMFQPSGAINMSNYNIFKIQVQLDKRKLLNYLKKFNTLFNLNDLNIQMNLTTFEYNFVRYQSGLAGLLFVN